MRISYITIDKTRADCNINGRQENYITYIVYILPDISSILVWYGEVSGVGAVIFYRYISII